jgi:hypothetical protein
MSISNRRGIVLAALSLVTAGAHAAVTGEHLREFALFGMFFAVVAVAELAWAVAIVERPTRQVVRLGVLCNLGLVTLWVLSRTVGLPIGPDAGMAEPVGRLDLLCTVAEVVIAVGGLRLRSRMWQGVQGHIPLSGTPG